MNRFIESRIFHILCTLTDLVILNLLYVLCCIPVVTIGAATTALYGTVLALLHDEGHLYTLFVRIFLKRFEQTTVFWLLWLTAVAAAAQNAAGLRDKCPSRGAGLVLDLRLSALVLGLPGDWLCVERLCKLPFAEKSVDPSSVTGGVPMKQNFGRLPDGRQADLYWIGDEYTQAAFTNLGAAIVRWLVPDTIPRRNIFRTPA